MSKTITITSKGQTTIPAAIRKSLNIPAGGGVLNIDFDQDTGIVTIVKQKTIEEISEKLSSYIKPGTKPLEDVDALYSNRDSRV